VWKKSNSKQKHFQQSFERGRAVWNGTTDSREFQACGPANNEEAHSTIV